MLDTGNLERERTSGNILLSCKQNINTRGGISGEQSRGHGLRNNREDITALAEGWVASRHVLRGDPMT